MKYIKYILIIIILAGLNTTVYAQSNPVGYCTGGETNGNTYQITQSVCTNTWKGTWSATDPRPPANPGPNPVGYCTGGDTKGNTYQITQGVCTNTWKGTWSATKPAPVLKPAAPAPKTNTNTKYQLLAPLPGVGDSSTGTFNTANGLGSYLNPMIKIFIGLCAVLSVVMIVIGGLEYMTSELISSKEEGKKKILSALGGLILALGAYALLFTINPDLLNSDINMPNATVATPAVNPGTDPEGTCTTSNGVYQETESACAELNGDWTEPEGICTTANGIFQETKSACDESNGDWKAN